MNGNYDRLRDARLIADTPLPDNYNQVIEDLTDEEIDLMISLKGRLDDAGIPTKPLSHEPGVQAESVVIL